MFTKEQHQNFSLGELASVRQQLQNQEQQRAKFIEKMFVNFAEDHDKFLERFDENVEDFDNVDCF